jgi:AcrR family transcriptional regulator
MHTSSLAAVPKHRTQASRRAATRAKLLGAVIECLERLGYANTTTTEICKAAGVSQGALFKHFPNKTALLAAATEQLFADLVDDYRTEFARSANDARIGHAIELLWAVFERPRLHVAFELYVAARTDRELAASLEPVARAHRENLHALARDYFPEAVNDERFDTVVDFVIDGFQGAALGALATPREDRDRMIAFATELARVSLASVK